MKNNDVIEPSSSPWASPIVLIRKKDGSTRFCADYRRLNNVTKKDSYPLPRIDNTLDTLAGNIWFSTLDLKSGYWQVELHPDDKEKTAFSTRLMETVLGGLSYEACLVYLDDIIIVGCSFEEHLKNIRRVLQKLKEANLKLCPSKCHLFRPEVTYIGYIISAEGVRTDPEKISAVKDWNCPTDVHQLRSFLGLCTYYRKFVKNFTTIAGPLHKLTEAKQKFMWTVDCNNAFNKLKDALTSAPILAYPEIGKQFILVTDASHESIEAVLSQEIDGQERVIAYFSKCLPKPERNYCEYNVEIRHKKGSAHGNADALSRRSCPESCKYCSRIEKNFGVIVPILRQVTTPSTSALDPWSDESVRKDQLADPEIKPIIEFKESSDEKPSWQDITPFHLTTKRYWALWDSLHVKNGVLYRKWESDDGKTFRWQLILPKTRISTVLKELHGSPTGGHFRVMKTLQKIRPRKRTRGRLQLYNVGAPFKRIAFDILGPLPRSSDGNNNILVAMDYFTKWPEAYPIPDQEASTVAEVLVQHWISRSGVPLQLHSDQGRNFDSAVCKRLCEILAIDKTRTTALHPQSDGMVKRNAVHETTGYSSSQMLFGHDLRLPADLLFSRPSDAPLAPEEYIEKLQARMEEMHHLARERIGMASEKMKTRYDARATGHDFLSSDLFSVWFGNSSNDHQARRRFVEWAQNEIAVVPDFHKRILFSDEAHFWLNGYVNKQNCRIWSEANPQVYVETPLHPEKLTVWFALWAGGIIGPYFKTDEGHNVTVNGDRYRAMITNFFIPELNNHDVQELWFQQDGATCHTARATIDLLKDTFGDCLISRFGPVNWPPRS
ncbi:hypothetical protein TNCV_1039701 [Trichonephila clavipes]|nr:hypothetical protein TNCV_1039701 [Trichonephila clavipes]